MKKFLVLFFTFFAADTILFWNLWSTFFQQDEWFLFGRAIYQFQHLPLSLFSFAAAHFWPFGSLYWILTYKVFGLNADIHAWLAIIGHSIAVTLTYFILEHLLKNKKASFILSLLLLLSFPARQIVVWYAVSFALPYSIIFLLLFLLILMKEKNELSIKTVFFLYLVFLLSLFFREEAVLALILGPAFILLFWNRERILRNKKKLVFLFGAIFLTSVLRFLLQKLIGDYVQFEQDSNLIMTTYNVITVPVKMVIQNIIDYDQLVDFSVKYARLSNPRVLPQGIIIITTVFETLTFLLVIPFIFLLGFAFSRLKKYERKVLLYGLIIIISYSLILSPQTRRLITLESRYLFFGGIGVLISFYYIYQSLLTIRNKIIITLVKSLFFLSIFSFILYSYIHTRYVINENYLPTSSLRESIINQIKTLHPSIPSHTVFYVQCKSKEDCIPNGLVLPFQSGAGQMLMVIYAKQNEKEYASFFKDFYLWDWEAEGYKEIGDIGFGYYRQKETLLRDYRKGKLKSVKIIALLYSRKENKISEVSPIVRKMLEDSVKSR